MTDAVFMERYKKLNAAQKEAVDALDGPVMVVAGPGTGKTTLLALRIANILRQTDTPADAILALTFTEAGVAAMRKKLLEIMGPRAYEVRVHTFHSFANALIKRYPEAFPCIVGAEHMEDIEQVHIVETLLARERSALLRPKNNPAYYVLPVINAIKELKREQVPPHAFAKLFAKGADAKSDKTKRSRALAGLYRAYEKDIARRRLYDFEDMVGETVRVLEKNVDFKTRVQEEYQYVLADEHQDANRSQNRLLELLCDYDPHPNLFIVGDAKQAIFRFQGASLENFSYFQKRFPRVRIIALTDNYRSQPTVLAAAHSLIEKSFAGSQHFLVPLAARSEMHRNAPLPVCVVEAHDETGELAWLVDAVRKLIASGAAPREVAVLCRENKDAEKVEQALKRAGISAARRGTSNALESVRVDALRKLFAAILDVTNDALLAPVLFFDFLRLPSLAVMEAVRARGGGSLVRRIARHGKELAAFQKKLLAWATQTHSDALIESFERIAHESGFIEHMLASPAAGQTFAHYAAFLQSATRYAERNKRAKLTDFLRRVERAEAHGIGVASSHEAPDGVAVLTAHKAKGLEFDHVFIVFAHEGKWGGKRSRELFELPIYEAGDMEDDTHDERRLFYVALTRARKSVCISWHAKDLNGRDELPSRFIFEMDEKTREHISLQNSLSSVLKSSYSGSASRDTDIFLLKNSSCSRRRARKFPLDTPAQQIFENTDYLNSMFLNQGFAVTHLNNYLECPLKYFFLNLVRLPRAQSSAELYGQAMHAGLAAYFNGYAREEESVRAARRAFENALRRTHLSEQEFVRYRVDGARELTGYLASQHFPRTCWNEYRVGGIFLPVGKEKVELTGMLDKVELLPSGGVAVVDYKTGGPKTRNEILGKTKNANSNYYRQLVFYQLLLNEMKVAASATRRGGGRGWRMAEGAIDFIKPAKNGSYRREVFVIDDGEVAALKKQLAGVAAEILDLSFLAHGCGKRECEWCRLYHAALPI